MLRLFRQWLTITKFVLIVPTYTKHLLVSHVLGLKTEAKCFFVNQIPVPKISGKFGQIFSFSVSPSNYTNWEFMLLMQQYHVQWCIQWNLFCNSHNLVLPEKNLKNKGFGSNTQVFKLLAWVPKIIQTYIIVT